MRDVPEPAIVTLPRAVTSAEGIALVEFALILPILILLLVGILDTGRAVNAYVTISNASREGARYVALNPTAAPSAIKSSAVLPHAQQLDAGSVTVSVTYSNDDPRPGRRHVSMVRGDVLPSVHRQHLRQWQRQVLRIFHGGYRSVTRIRNRGSENSRMSEGRGDI